MSDVTEMSKPVLHIVDILRWADAHYDRTGEWPETKFGELFDGPDEKWVNIDQALYVEAIMDSSFCEFKYRASATRMVTIRSWLIG